MKKGKLILIPANEELRKANPLKKFGKYFGKLIPIVVSNEPIKISDHWINILDPTLGIRIATADNVAAIKRMKMKKNNAADHCKKVLVLPNEFSQEQLKDICDGKFNNEVDIMVETTIKLYLA